MKSLSIFDQPALPPQTMPLKLRAVLAGYGVWILQDAWLLAVDSGDPKVAVQIAISALALVFLIRGNDLVRGILRVLAVLAGALGILAVVQLGSLGVTSWITISAGISTVISAFTFWALGQDDVRSWMRARSPTAAMPPVTGSSAGERTR